MWERGLAGLATAVIAMLIPARGRVRGPGEALDAAAARRRGGRGPAHTRGPNNGERLLAGGLLSQTMRALYRRPAEWHGRDPAE